MFSYWNLKIRASEQSLGTLVLLLWEFGSRVSHGWLRRIRLESQLASRPSAPLRPMEERLNREGWGISFNSVTLSLLPELY